MVIWPTLLVGQWLGEKKSNIQRWTEITKFIKTINNEELAQHATRTHKNNNKIQICGNTQQDILNIKKAWSRKTTQKTKDGSYFVPSSALSRTSSSDSVLTS